MFKKSSRLYSFLGVLGAIFTTSPAWAVNQAESIPVIDSIMLTIRTDITGFWAYTIIVLAFVGAGVAFAMGEQGSIFKKLGGIVMGGALALGAATLVSSLFASTGLLLN